MKTRMLGLLVAMTATSAHAHPDHLSEPVQGLAHLVTDPFHLAAIGAAVAAAAGLAFGARRLRRERQRDR